MSSNLKGLQSSTVMRLDNLYYVAMELKVSTPTDERKVNRKLIVSNNSNKPSRKIIFSPHTIIRLENYDIGLCDDKRTVRLEDCEPEAQAIKEQTEGEFAYGGVNGFYGR